MIIKNGDSGDQVKIIQELLVKHGYSVTIDGDFGPKTEEIIKKFQASKGLTADGVIGPITMAHLQSVLPPVTIKSGPIIPPGATIHETIIENMKARGYTIHDGEYQLNLVGLRKIPGSPNSFDDTMVCFYRKDGIIISHEWPITTDPGVYWLQNFSRSDGTAILIPGNYPKCWVLGKHKGQYEALTQAGTGVFKVWRDADKNRNVDYTGQVYTNVGGLNCHKAGTSSTVVDKWSAGCQVHAKDANFYEMMSLIHKQLDAGKSTFDYTLFEWDGLNILG